MHLGFLWQSHRTQTNTQHREFRSRKTPQNSKHFRYSKLLWKIKFTKMYIQRIFKASCISTLPPIIMVQWKILKNGCISNSSYLPFSTEPRLWGKEYLFFSIFRNCSFRTAKLQKWTGRFYKWYIQVVYKWYILPIEGLYATYHLLGEPETTIDLFIPSTFKWRKSISVSLGVENASGGAKWCLPCGDRRHL